MPDAVQDAVLVGPGVERAVAGAVLGRTVEVGADGDGRHGDRRLAGQSRFIGVIVGLTRSQAEPPPVVVHDDVDVIGIVEGRGGQVIGGVVEVPQR